MNVSGSNNILINGYQAHRVTDPWQVHCCGSICHQSTQASGSRTVIYNSLPLARVGDSIACGSSNATGSNNHIAGG